MPGRALAFLLFCAFLLSLSPPEAKTGAQGNALSVRPRAAVAVPAPEEVLGFRPGDDRKLATWASVVEYFKRLDMASDRVKFEELGKTTMGAPFVMATISAPENLRRLNEFNEIQRQLADPRTLGANADRKARQLVARGKTIVLITCGIHSTEVGSYLSSMLIAHRLASSDDAEVQNILRNCIVLLVPSLNPDGVDIVKNWYDRTLGTPYEGTDPPTLYHKYTGHDNNRDWYAFTQAETLLAVDKIHNVWHPQIVHDIHQMGRNGARLFLPPYTPPVEPNVPKQIVEGYTELGRSVAAEMRAAGFKGIVTDAIFDAWTPARAYSHYHGGVRILSETASAKIATPVTVNFDELREGRNYDPRVSSANFPELWAGGEWRLRDITNYMTAAAFSLLKHAAQNRERWLTRFYEIGKEAVRPRKKGEVYAYAIPPSAHRADLLRVLGVGDVEVDIAPPFKAGGVAFPDSTAVVRMAQPASGFVKALLETQHYPDLRDSSGKPVAPYDVTAHTLPLLMGVKVHEVRVPFRNKTYTDFAGCEGWGGYPQRIAIYQSHIPSMDEGWTRFVIERQWGQAVKDKDKPIYTSLLDREARAGNLHAKYDAIIIPDQSPPAILDGHKPGSMPEEYTGGLGAEGVKSLSRFAQEGGTLIFLNRASRFAIEQLRLPVRDATANLKRTEFYAPGSILRLRVDTSHPIARSMPEESIAWVEDSPAFEVKRNMMTRSQVRVIAGYPLSWEPLLSGWLLGGDLLKGKAALVEIRWGKGRIYLFGFRPQYRGQSLATYPLLFGAIEQAQGN